MREQRRNQDSLASAEPVRVQLDQPSSAAPNLRQFPAIALPPALRPLELLRHWRIIRGGHSDI
jgi:hypothetical protein